MNETEKGIFKPLAGKISPVQTFFPEKNISAILIDNQSLNLKKYHKNITETSHLSSLFTLS
jgi:hypothetical protein